MLRTRVLQGTFALLAATTLVVGCGKTEPRPDAGDAGDQEPAPDSSSETPKDSAKALAPDFELPDPSGALHKLSDFRGKVVVIEWLNHGCPYVKKHYGAGNMQKLQAEAAAKGAVWLSICSSAEGKEGYHTAAEWPGVIAEHKSVATHVLLDPKGDVGRRYQAKVTPHMFVIDAAGAVAYQGAIDDNKSADPATIPGATNYVMATVDALLAGQPAPYEQTKPYG